MYLDSTLLFIFAQFTSTLVPWVHFVCLHFIATFLACGSQRGPKLYQKWRRPETDQTHLNKTSSAKHLSNSAWFLLVHFRKTGFGSFNKD